MTETDLEITVSGIETDEGGRKESYPALGGNYFFVVGARVDMEIQYPRRAAEVIGEIYSEEMGSGRIISIKPKKLDVKSGGTYNYFNFLDGDNNVPRAQISYNELFVVQGDQMGDTDFERFCAHVKARERDLKSLWE